MKLFKPNLVYPCDGIGEHIELIGRVIEVKEQEDPDHEVRVVVETNKGVFDAYTDRPPKLNYAVKIRVYNSGGGWYPDNRIVGWSSAGYPEYDDLIQNKNSWFDRMVKWLNSFIKGQGDNSNEAR